jgi:serine/threonine-protein kinase
MSETRTLAGRYRLDARAGSGAMGTVWQATDLRSGQRVAVKLLHPHLATDPEYLRRFRREARVDLRSPYVVRVLDDGQDGEDQFLVMEYVEGKTLAEEQRRGSLPPERAAQITRQVA